MLSCDASDEEQELSFISKGEEIATIEDGGRRTFPFARSATLAATAILAAIVVVLFLASGWHGMPIKSVRENEVVKLASDNPDSPLVLTDTDPFDPDNPPVREKISLPGRESTEPYEYYSGYLDAGTPPSGRGKMYFHYICAMAPDWRNKPLSIWYNGGPGAPSTYGLFQEFGPFLLTGESYGTEEFKRTGIPTPLYNPWTWANLTSLCEIDSPPPVGASYCSKGNGSASSQGGPAGDPYTCGPWTDFSTADANHKAHIALFNDAFPEFEETQQPITIFGESYAGMYVPLFIDRWLDDPIKGPNGTLINLKGFAVGDGLPGCIKVKGKKVDWCIDLENVEFFKYPNALPGPFWDLEFFHGHGQMSESLYDSIKKTCSTKELKGIRMPLSSDCAKLFSVNMTQEVGFFYAYEVFDACPEHVPVGFVAHPGPGRRLSEVPQKRRPTAHRRMLSGNARGSKPIWPQIPSPGNGDSGVGAPCLADTLNGHGDACSVYLNNTKVLEGLGIPLNNNYVNLDNGIGMNYTTNSGFIGYVYEKAIKAGKRVLVYEGDTDACGLQTAPIEDVWVPFFGDKANVWTPMGRLKGKEAKPLGLKMTQPWRLFGVEPAGRRVQGGFVIEWEGGQVTFASIRGAGHLAPLFRPAAAYTMMKAFQEGKSVPPPIYP